MGHFAYKCPYKESNDNNKKEKDKNGLYSKKVVVPLKMRRMVQMMKLSLWISILLIESMILKNVRSPSP